MIKIQNISKTYALGATPVLALNNVVLNVEAGQFVAIAGASGSGKSTLLNIIGAVERPTRGRVEIEGTDLNALSSDQLAEFRAQKLGFVFQTFNLFPIMTAFENVEYPLQLRKMPKVERSEKVLSALADVGLTSYLHHKPAQLSGGQRQRVAIARALVGKPALVLADEPTANLDHATGLEILELLKELNRKNKTTLLFATHDPNIMQMADRVVTILDGQIVKDSQCI